MPGPLSLRRAVASVTLFAALAGLPAGTAGAGPDRPPVRRVLVLSLPGTTWAAVAGARVPNLDALFAAAAVGSTSVRAIERETRPGDGYVTIGAGTAAAGVARVEGLAFDAGEPRPELAGIAGYRLGSPVAGPAGAVVSTGGPELARDARHRHRGAEIGALGEA
ncbi:MAG TPA: hypothetical protein VEN99_10410, partial [Acidimicrobiia bacterium]|nr:hypothetical protein [Acidimicrobiia bacterium]